MRIWYSLLLAPVLALTDQSVAFATSGWACSHQHASAVHAVHGLFLVAIVAGTVVAWRYWRSLPEKAAEPVASRYFLAALAAASGALSALVVLAMWIPTWALSPCFN